MPTKLTGAALSSWCASRVSSLPLLSSSPTDSRPTRGASHAERHARVGGAHDRELHEMLRPAFDGRAGIEQDRRLPARRDDRRQRRPIDARQPAERAVRRHHRRAGVTGAEQRRPRRPSRTASAATPDRGARLAPQRRGGGFRHLDALRGVEERDVEGARAGMPRQLLLDRVAGADQQQADWRWRAATSAPSMILPGASSPPIASMAIRITYRGSHAGVRGSRTLQDADPRGSTTSRDADLCGSTTSRDADLRGSITSRDADLRGSHHITGRGSSRIYHVTGRGSSRIHHVTGRGSSRIHHITGRGSSRTDDLA